MVARLAFPAALAACLDLTPMVKSTVLLDGRKFVAARCTSAAREGFHGVDLTSPSGETLRIVPQPDGSALVVLFPPGDGEAVRLVDCAKARIPRSTLKVGGVPAVSGWASFACEAGGRRVEGSVEFERCH